MKAGFTITAPVTRQVSIDDATTYRDLGKAVGYATLGFMILAFLAANHIDADTLPIWACYDCLVLISHLPLINTAMPGRTSVFLSEIAKILRFTFVHVEDWYSDLDTGNAALPLSNLFMQNGYTASSIIINLAMILLLFGLLLLALVFAKCVDCSYLEGLRKPNLNGRTETRALTAT